MATSPNQHGDHANPARERPIGVFDSGVGGLTVLRALRARLPHEHTVYLGDTARVPYGTRSADTVITYAVRCAETLVRRADIKCLVVACNTVSAVALPRLQSALSIPVVGVITPGAQAALAALAGPSAPATKVLKGPAGTESTVGVLGTAGTIRSRAYDAALKELGHTGKVSSVPCPLFVPLAEEGWLTGPVPALVADRYLNELAADVAVVVLGCTHYPLLAPIIETRLASLRPDAVVVNGAEATAEATHHRLLVTDAPSQMALLAPAFLGANVDANDVEGIDLSMT